MPDSTPFDDLDDLNASQLNASDRLLLVDALADEVRELFHGYVQGDVPFDELTFEMFDALQTLHAITHGAAIIEYGTNDDLDDIGGRHDPSSGPGSNGRTQPGNSNA